MKIPLMQKIEIQDVSLESLKIVFERNPIGKAPFLFVLDESIIGQRDIFAKNCMQLFKQFAINPLFPYPNYIICPERIEDCDIAQLKSIDKAPKHFIKKIKRVKNREQSLLSKADTYQARIQNQSIDQDLNYIARKREDNRKLRDLCHQKNFCIQLVESLREKS